MKEVIPREQWPDFFARFVRSHVGHVCSLAVKNRDESFRVGLNRMVLAAVGPDSRKERQVRILLTDWSGHPITYAVAGANHVARTAEGASETLEIDGGEAMTTITFQPAS